MKVTSYNPKHTCHQFSNARLFALVRDFCCSEVKKKKKKPKGKKIPILFNPCFSHDQNFNEVDDDTCDNCSSFLISFGESADVFEKDFKGKKFKNFIILVNSEIFF